MSSQTKMSDDNIKVLQVFGANSKKLQDAVKKHVPEKTTIKYEVDKPTQIVGSIDETTEAGLVATARLFMGDNASNFGKVVNILLAHYQSDNTKVERLRQYKKAWKTAFGLNPIFRLGSEEDNLTNEKIFDIVAYGSHLHSTNFDEHFKLQNSWLYPMVKIQLESLILNIQKLTTLLDMEFVRPVLAEELG